MFACRIHARRGTGLAAIVLAAACGTSPSSPKLPVLSDALSGALFVTVDRADDFGYRVELSLHPADGAVVTITKAELTLFAPTGVIVKPLDAAVLSSKADQFLTFPNEPGLGLATSGIATVMYVSGAGPARSLSVSKSIPACWDSYEAHCAPSHLDVGQTSQCSGGIEWCSPMFFPLSGSGIQWQSRAQEVATVSPNGTLTATSNGVAVIVGSFGSGVPVSFSFPMCVGPLCKPDSLEIRPRTDSLAVGAKQTFQAALSWAGQGPTLTTAGEWDSTNPVVGTFQSKGLPNVFSALSPGTTTVTATYLGVSGVLVVTVK